MVASRGDKAVLVPLKDVVGNRKVVPTGLVPVSVLGKKFGVKTPAIDTIINLADILFEADFRASGRNLAQLGLSQLSQEEIITL